MKRILQAITRSLAAPEVPFATGERRRAPSAGARAASGAAAEFAALALIRRKRYRVLCRNRVNAIGEIDIIARDGETIVFVEVRSRKAGSPVDARDTVTAQKLRTLTRAAELFCRQHDLLGTSTRIDLIAVQFGERGEVAAVEHYEGIA